MNNLTINRTPVTPSHLLALVQQKLAELMAAKAEFTAYTITLALRQDNPLLEIIHEDVRQIVHDQMQQFLGVDYDVEDRQYPDTNWALTYFPYQPITVVAQQPAQITAPAPQLPASILTTLDD